MTHRDTRYALFNRDGATTNVGAELLATARGGPWVGTATYTYVRSREEEDARQICREGPDGPGGGAWPGPHAIAVAQVLQDVAGLVHLAAVDEGGSLSSRR